ncbi:T9SS type A sorting domain-containing protein [Sporocytophaga myxococcoides]|uniref:T9SS type A sorting domain-containing protein n=1 Tax=Sporocytophaga myxococcoides TaxID=153721 RepID=UPI00042665CC|nr:T9SS type A sorting domain-containing protein [Sporocytophaga myxococcoides]
MIKKLLLFTLFFGTIHITMAQPQKLANLGVSGQCFKINSTVLFEDGNLWKTNGTPESTLKLTSFGTQNQVREQIASDNVLYFTVDGDGGYINQLWKSDGTVSGTVPVKIFTPANENSISNLYYWNGTTYFLVADRLYKTDGTEAGTVQIKDLAPTTTSGSADALFYIKNTLFIVFQHQLWKSDGTTSGTTLLRSFDYMNYLNSFGDYAMLEVIDSAHGREPWKLDEAGNTQLIKDINPGPTGSVGWGYSNSGYEFNGYYYFTVSNPYRLFRTDGTEAGTTEFMDGIVDVRPLNDKLYIFNNNELWRTDGISSPQLVRAFDKVLGTYCTIGDLIITSEGGKKLWVFNSNNDSFKFITEYPDTDTDTLRMPDIGSIIPAGNDVYYTLQTEEVKFNESEDDYTNTIYEFYKYSPFQSGTTSLTLVNAATEADIRSLKSVDTVYTDESVNIRANPFGTFTSVQFYLNGTLYKTATSAPHTLGDYSSGDYLQWPNQEGVYKIKATTVSDSNNLPATITLHVIKRDITSTIKPNTSYSAMVIYPNPVIDNMSIKIDDIDEVALISITDLNGKECYSGKRQIDSNGIIETDLSELPMESGIYVVKVITASGMRISKVLKK